MIIKFLALVAVLFVIYIAFFKKSNKEVRRKKSNGKKNITGDTMLECANCETFVSEDESIIKDGKFYCSKECAKL